MHEGQWAMVRGRNLEVSAEDYERVRGELRQITFELDRLKLSAERASDR
jgi:hypothetical protein